MMRTSEFLKRGFSTQRMNIRHFLKLYFCNEAKFSIGKMEKIRLDGKFRKAYNVNMNIDGKEVDMYAVLNKKLNGCTLFIPDKERAVRFKIRDRVNINKEGLPMEKKARVEYFKQDSLGNSLIGTFGKYLKEKQGWAWCN